MPNPDCGQLLTGWICTGNYATTFSAIPVSIYLINLYCEVKRMGICSQVDNITINPLRNVNSDVRMLARPFVLGILALLLQHQGCSLHKTRVQNACALVLFSVEVRFLLHRNKDPAKGFESCAGSSMPIHAIKPQARAMTKAGETTFQPHLPPLATFDALKIIFQSICSASSRIQAPGCYRPRASAARCRGGFRRHDRRHAHRQDSFHALGGGFSWEAGGSASEAGSWCGPKTSARMRSRVQDAAEVG